ncbi:C2 domain - like 10 [Theobroma cacao]|nr:C2 domain - like 10 [Theobroma cacao]
MGQCLSSDVNGGQQASGHTSMLEGNVGRNDAVDFFFRSRGQHSPSTGIELSLSASKLSDRDITSKSDPMAILYAKRKDGSLKELGRTEVILNNLNPAWVEKIHLTYQFETVQSLVFHVYDVDSVYHNVPVKMLKLSDQDFLGEANCVLSEILTKRNQTLTLNLQSKHGHGGSRNLGMLTVHAEETVASRTIVEMVLRCSQLDNKDLFSKSDPFLRISKIAESVGCVPIYKTEDNPLILECFDFNSSGNHVLIGKIQKSVSELEKLYKEKSGANLVLSSRQGHDKVLKGQLFVDQFIEKPRFSFLDYISSGFQLNFMVAVDFTSSNGLPRNPTSLHYIDPLGRLNSYQQVEGVEGIMAAYASAIYNVTLSGPTVFGQVIDRAAQLASFSCDSTKYFVLLIITDGVLTDIQETKDAVVKTTDLPLSILIVGVGDADFKQMEILDADDGCPLVSSNGRVATRDIVQFVPMREVHGGQISLVEALLQELPGQFLTYMQSRNIKPYGFVA